MNEDGDAKCCPIGSNCVNDSPCSSDAYFCTTTVTVSGTASPTEVCCDRLCPQTSQYLCPPDLGGKCCNFDSECRADGSCVSTQEPSSTDGLKPIEEGCTTSQYRCNDGNGCCDNDQSCTEVSGTGFCASGRPTETDLDFIDDEGSPGLSDGAKAGIGVGAVLGAALIIGLFVWLCIYKRRRSRQSGNRGYGSSGSGHQHAEDAAGMTEVTQSPMARQGGQGPTQDYFGPHPVAGPYTEAPDQYRQHSNTTSPGPHRALPPQPNQPGDITAPVEMDSESRAGDGRMSPLSYPSSHASPQPQPETIEGRFELYGELQPEQPPPPRSRSPSILQTPAAYKASRKDEW